MRLQVTWIEEVFWAENANKVSYRINSKLPAHSKNEIAHLFYIFKSLHFLHIN